MKFHPDVLAAHAEFGGDLETMQKLYDYPDLVSRISQQDAELDRLRREVEEARADKARLDFLDECNARLNTHHGTTYGWEMVMNHDVNRLMTGHLAVDLNDAKAHGFKSCRGAIDEEIKRIEAARAARKKAEESRT